MHMDRKTHANIGTFQVKELEGGNNVITSDDQPIYNRSKEEQVCIHG